MPIDVGEIDTSDPSYNRNQRLPPVQMPSVYPYIDFEYHRDGSHERWSTQTGKEHHIHTHFTGAFKSMEWEGQHKALTGNDFFHYTIGGHSHTADENQHEKKGAGMVDHITESDHAEVGGPSRSRGIGASDIFAAKNDTSKYQVKKFDAKQEDSVKDATQNEHDNYEGDHVTYVKGTKYTSVGAEHGTYVPNGNMDIRIGNKYKLISMQNLYIESFQQIWVESQQQIVLQVNGQSGIIIEPDQLTITSPTLILKFNSNPGTTPVVGTPYSAPPQSGQLK
jgi:hypothetical protein